MTPLLLFVYILAAGAGVFVCFLFGVFAYLIWLYVLGLLNSESVK
jgi:hypothetical protein